MRNVARSVALVVVLAFAAVEGSAQSLYNAAGIGLPVEPIDGRARALGNLGIGLPGNALLPGDPAAAGMLLAPSAVVVGQPSWVDYEQGAASSGSFQGNRFPLLGIGYPAATGMFTFMLSSFLDQHYEARRSVDLSLRDQVIPVTDIFEQQGSVGSVMLGFSQPIGETAGVGINVGRYAGSVLRRLERDFTDVLIPGELASYEAEGNWTYSGASVTGGGLVDLGSIVRLSASVTWSSALEATPDEDTVGGVRSYSLPFQYRAGASAVLSPGLMVTTSVVRADWGGIEDDILTPATVGSTSGFGVGFELSRARLLGMAAPLRFGYRRSELPFTLAGDVATERVFAAGLGVSFSETNGIVLGGADFAIERGRRSDSSLTESFWRATVSLRISGY